MRELELPVDKMPTVDELKSSHRRLVKQCHPDLHPGDPNALQKFKSLQTTYEGINGYYDQVNETAEQLATKLDTHFARHAPTKGWKNDYSTLKPQSASFPTDHLSPSQKEALIQELREHGLAVEEHYAVEIGGNVISVSGAFKGSSPSAEIAQKLQARFATGVTPAGSTINQAEKPPTNTAESVSAPKEAISLEGPESKTGHSKGKATDTLKDTSRSEKATATVSASEGKATDALKSTSGSKKATATVGASESKAADTLRNTTWSETVTARAGVSENKMADALKAAAKSEKEAVAKAGGRTAWIVGGIIAATVAVGAYIMHTRKSAAAREQERQQKNDAARGIS
ncbi:MAG: DnaJ domain-containing protein [Thermoguttaceae bacterium]